MKTLNGFEFDRSGVSAPQMRTLAEGEYVTKAEPVLLVGEAGTGKTHLATGLCVAACRQRRRVRFTTATALINDPAKPLLNKAIQAQLAPGLPQISAELMFAVAIGDACRFEQQAALVDHQFIGPRPVS